MPNSDNNSAKMNVKLIRLALFSGLMGIAFYTLYAETEIPDKDRAQGHAEGKSVDALKPQTNDRPE